MAVDFRKMHGAGNDFVLIEGPGPDVDLRAQAPRLCARRTGVGADGLVLSTLVRRYPDPLLEVVCVNADGSVASMCGNALRCAAWAASVDHGIHEMTLLLAGVNHWAVVEGERVAVTVEAGAVETDWIQVPWVGTILSFDAVHTGTEHVVALVDRVDDVDVAGVGPVARRHRHLAPIGANVNFVEILDRTAVRVRTYERGVEDETLSCGSGAVASVLVAASHGLLDPGPVSVHNRSGQPLSVRPDERPGTWWVEGPVSHSYSGQLVLA